MADRATTSAAKTAAAGKTGKVARERQDRILLRRYQQTRDPQVRDELVERFMPFARSLARRYITSPESIEDLTQVAAEGLIKAIDNYEVSRGNPFVSYASPVILGHLRHHLRDATQPVHLPRGLQERVQKVSKAAERARAECGEEPSPRDIASRTELTEAEVIEALTADGTRRPMSLDTPTRGADGEDAAPMAEWIGRSDLGYDRVEASIAGSGVDLDEREVEALRLRFGHNLKQREIGERIGVSQMQVSRLLRRSLDKLLAAVRGEEEAPGGAPASTTAPQAARDKSSI